MGQIPIGRGTGDTAALERATSELRAGACIGIFLEGTRTAGRPLRARSGFGRLAQAVPEAQIVCFAGSRARLSSSASRDVPGWRVRFFRPAGGGLAAKREPGRFHRPAPGRDPGRGASGRVRSAGRPYGAGVGPGPPVAGARTAPVALQDPVVPGEWFEWEWDETLFAGAAAFYDRGRLPNAPGLADALQKALGLDGRGRLLDVGCGPGTVTLPLADLFQEAVGLDADAGMIREAQRLACERGVMNARWVHGRAEDLPAGLGTFGVVTFAASFHWMDRPLVARVHPTDARAGRRRCARRQSPPTAVSPSATLSSHRRSSASPNSVVCISVRTAEPAEASGIPRPVMRPRSFCAAGFRRPGTGGSFPTVARFSGLRMTSWRRHSRWSSTAPHLFGDRLSQFGGRPPRSPRRSVA